MTTPPINHEQPASRLRIGLVRAVVRHRKLLAGCWVVAAIFKTLCLINMAPDLSGLLPWIPFCVPLGNVRYQPTIHEHFTPLMGVFGLPLHNGRIYQPNYYLRHLPIGPGYIALTVCLVAVFVLTGLAFMRPTGRWVTRITPKMSHWLRPLTFSFFAALAVTGFLAGVADACGYWLVLTFRARWDQLFIENSPRVEPRYWTWLAIGAASWLAFACMTNRLRDGWNNPARAFMRLLALLTVGAAMVAVAWPIAGLVERPSRLSGWYTTFFVGSFVILWTWGCIVSLLPAMSKWVVEYDRALCASCGYDLRASRDKCPECGAAITAWHG